MRIWKIAGVALVVVVVASLVTGLWAFAQDDGVTPAPEEDVQESLPGPRFERGRGMRGEGMGPDRFGLADGACAEAIAEALGLTVEELQARLADGERLPDVAEALGVEWADVQEAIEAARVAQIEQAVADGDLTQEEADQILERMAQRADLSEAMEAMRLYQIEQALAAGAITQEQADLLQEFGGGWGKMRGGRMGLGGLGGMRGGRMGPGGLGGMRGGGFDQMPGVSPDDGA